MFAVAIFLPLLAAIVAGFFGRWIGDRGAQIVTCGGLLISMLISWWMLYTVGLLLVFLGLPYRQILFRSDRSVQ